MRKFLTILAGAVALMGIAAATAAAGNTEGGKHWPHMWNWQVYKYSLNFVDGTGPGSDSRWLQGGYWTGYPFDEQISGTLQDAIVWQHATPTGNCNWGVTHICVMEYNDPTHLGCGTYAHQTWDGCAYINWIDGLNHTYFSIIELNWLLMVDPPGDQPARSRAYRQRVYTHEVGHTQGLAHRAAHDCRSPMIPVPEQNSAHDMCDPIPFNFDTHDRSTLQGLYWNHFDTYSYSNWGMSRERKPTRVLRKTTLGRAQLRAAAKQAQHASTPGHDMIITRKDPNTPRTITEFTNGVIKVEKGGRTYWLGNKQLTKAEREWYVDQGVLAAGVIR